MILFHVPSHAVAFDPFAFVDASFRKRCSPTRTADEEANKKGMEQTNFCFFFFEWENKFLIHCIFFEDFIVSCVCCSGY